MGTSGPSAAVASDGSIYVPGGVPLPRGRAGAVLRLAPIIEVDETPPSLSVDAFSLVRRRGSPRVAGRLRYTLSEDASVRVSLLRRAKTMNRRHRDFGKFLFMGRIDVPAATAGRRTLVLDWRRLGSRAHLPPGVFRLTLIARDDSGNESRPARVTFRIRR